MTDEERLKYFLADMKLRGQRHGDVFPPFFRLLWWMGIKVRPPLFLPFWNLAFFSGAIGGLLWGTAMYFILWQRYASGPATSIFGGIAFGAFFGCALAITFRTRAKKLELGDWADYPDANRNAILRAFSDNDEPREDQN